MPPSREPRESAIPYFPLDGNGGYDVDHYDLALALRPGYRRAARHGHDQAPGRRRTCPASTSTSSGLKVRPDRASTALARPGTSRPAGADGHARASALSEARPVHGAWCATTACLSRRSSRPSGPTGFFADRRRLRHRRAAPRRRDVVPGQRPPDRQGVVHLPRHRAGRPRGRRQRAPRRQRTARRLDDLDLGRAATRWRPTWPPSTSASSQLDALPRGRDPLSATPSTRTCSTRGRRRRPAPRFAVSQTADQSYKRLTHDDQRPGRRGDRRRSTVTRDTELD